MEPLEPFDIETIFEALFDANVKLDHIELLEEEDGEEEEADA